MKSNFVYNPKFLANPDEVFLALQNELQWERRGSTPRSEYYINTLGDIPYQYGSGQGVREYLPRPIHPVVAEMLVQLQKEEGAAFDVCFLNRYHNQKDHLGWHADDSPEMDDNRPIAIISLGVEREIWFRENAKPEEIVKLKLEHGSLCLMAAGTQDTHQHRIPKAGFTCGERISLTFRGYVTSSLFETKSEFSDI